MKHKFHLRYIALGIWGILLLGMVGFVPARVTALVTDTPSPLPSETSSPTQVPTSTPTVIPTATHTIEERVAHLEEKAALPQKDGWDIFKIIADVVTALIVGGGITFFGIWVTRSFNKRQLDQEKIRGDAQQRIAESQIVQSFMPQLLSNEPRTVEMALLTIASLENEALVGRLAGLYRNEGSFAAISKMAASSNPKVAEAVESSLRIFRVPYKATVQIKCGNEVRGAGFFVRQDGYVVTTYNVVDVTGEFSVITAHATFPAQIVAKIEQDNLALIKVNGSGFSTIPIPEVVVEPEINDEAHLIGYDAQAGLSAVSGQVVGKIKLPEYLRSDLFSVKVSVPRKLGGAVAIDKNGQFIGMVVLLWIDNAKTSTTAYVLPAASVADFVRDKIAG